MAEPNALKPEPKHQAMWALSEFAKPEPGEMSKPVIKKVNWKRIARDNAAERIALIEQMEGPGL